MPKKEKKQISLYCKWLGIFLVSPILGAINIGAIGSVLKILALVPVGIWMFTKCKVKINKYFLISLFYVIWCALSFFWSVNLESTISRIVTQITFLLLLTSSIGYRYSVQEVQYLKSCLIWSSRLTAILVIMFADYLYGRIFFNGILQEDPNYLCGYFIFAMVNAVSILLSSNMSTKRKKFGAILEMILYVYILLGTGSRGGIIAVTVAVFAMLFFYGEEKKIDLAIILKKIIFPLLIILAIVCVIPFLAEDVLLRFSLENILNSKGTGRFQLWDDGLRAFLKSGDFRKLCGYGTATVLKIGEMFLFARNSVMHNIFIETLLELGIIGLCLYIGHVFGFLYVAIKQRDYFSFSAMVCMIVLSLSLSLYSFKPYWNIMIYLLCVVNCVGEKSNIKVVR